MVPGSIHMLVVNYEDLTVDALGRGCGNTTLNSNRWFQIQPNDIISACIINDSNIEPLFITSRPNNGVPADQMNVDVCIDDQLGVINTNQQRTRTRRRLSLHASICKLTL